MCLHSFVIFNVLFKRTVKKKTQSILFLSRDDDDEFDIFRLSRVLWMYVHQSLFRINLTCLLTFYLRITKTPTYTRRCIAWNGEWKEKTRHARTNKKKNSFIFCVYGRIVFLFIFALFFFFFLLLSYGIKLFFVLVSS